MSDVELDLISSVITCGDMAAVLEARVHADYFEDPEHLQVWSWAVEHWNRYGKAPGQLALKANFPAYRLSKTPEPLSYYLDVLRERRTFTILRNSTVAVGEALNDNDVDGAQKIIAATMTDLYSDVSRLKDDQLTRAIDRRLALYDDLARNPGRLRGFSTGYGVIDRATRGVQPEQYIVLAGPPKSSKSTVLMDMGIRMNEMHNARVLLVSFEMSQEEQAARHDAIRAKINYNKLMDGQLAPKELRRLKRTLHDLPQYEDFVVSTDISACTTVTGIRAQVHRIQPDVVLVDGIYLMEDENDEPAGSPRALTNISRGLKRLAQATRIPVIGTTQALEYKMRRGQMQATSVGYASAFGQDADVLLGLERHPEEVGISILRVLLSRSGPLAYTNLRIDWNSSTISEEAPYEADEDEDVEPTGSF